MNREERKELMQKIKDENPDIISIGYGRKIKNGEYTGEFSIICGVAEKKSISDINPEKIIPHAVQFGSEQILTDVIEDPKLTVLACDQETIDNCLIRTTSANFWDPDFIPNRITTRPLVGGLSMTKTSGLNSSVGTFGFIAVDSDTDCLVGITNNHVATKLSFVSSDFPSGGDFYYTTSTEEAYQTGEPYASITSSEKIGRIKNAYPLNKTTSNLIDAAKIVLDESPVSLDSSFNICAFPHLGPYPFATTLELDGLLENDIPIASSGRSTGAKYPESCGIQVYSVDNQTNVGGYGWFLNNTTTSAPFQDVIYTKRINPDCGDPSRGGDSGSAVLGNFGGTWKIIGLHFAGNSSIGAFCRIDYVASLLGIEAWDGSPKNFMDKNSPSFHYVSGTTSEKFVTVDGKKYWQIGILNN
jgi:hypothetical protein